jgi:hypothetical protein
MVSEKHPPFPADFPCCFSVSFCCFSVLCNQNNNNNNN